MALLNLPDTRKANEIHVQDNFNNSICLFHIYQRAITPLKNTRTVFDNVIVNNEGRVVLINETKFGKFAKLTQNQELYHVDGKSVVFTGKKAED